MPDGDWTLPILRLSQASFLIVATSAIVQPAAAAEKRTYDVPPGRLGDALIAFGRQAGVSVGTAEAGLSAIQVPGVKGRYSFGDALHHLINRTPLRVVQIDAQSFTIIRSAPPPRAATKQKLNPSPPDLMVSRDIVVTASKRSTPIGLFPASVQMLDLGSDLTPPTGATGTEALVARLPIMASTALGRGRNKLFIRGIADSSFTGPTQATVGQYLGEVRLNYNAPDPDLSLYDIESVEVVEGPQGTLYGAGSLGGIVRLTPRLPDANETSASLDMGVTATRSGRWGQDMAAMINLPLVANRGALRLVGYEVGEGGYIDDAQRQLIDINRTRIRGGRAALHVDMGDDWRLDLGAVMQVIDARDSQYAERSAPPLSRRSTIAQPFDNDYSLWNAVLRKSWHGLDLVSATGLVRHDVGERYDATGFSGTTGPIAFDEDDNIRLLTHETRLFHDGRNIGWVVGVAAVNDSDEVRRRLGSPAAPEEGVGVRNTVTEGSLFGEGTLALTRTLSGTLGARLTYAHLSGHPVGAPDIDAFEPDRDETRLLPTAALSWRPQSSLLVFARYQEGFRAGGLTIGQVEGATAISRFRPDRMRSIEAGLRRGDESRDVLSGSATLSYTRWRNIQADLIEPDTLPSTVNIGNGRIYGFEANARWRPWPSLALNATLFLNDSGLAVPAVGVDHAEIEELPNIAPFGAAATLGWNTRIATDIGLAAEASARYVGRSTVGIGPLDLVQSDYVDASFNLRVEWRRFAASLGVANVFDTRGNRFALGNPFSAATGDQTTPLRPRHIRLGVDARF